MKIIHRSFREQESRDRALVLRAMDIDHELDRGIVGWRIGVPPEEEANAREQWRLYDLENPVGRPPGAVPDHPVHKGAGAGTLCWALVMFGFFILQSRHGLGIDWARAGVLDVGAVRSGEWWRAVTALTLHVDAPHLFAQVIAAPGRESWRRVPCR